MQPNYKLNCMVVEFTSFLCYQYVGGFFFYFKKKIQFVQLTEIIGH